MKEFGQYRPLVVQESTMYVLVGNGALDAAIKLKKSELDCFLIDVNELEAEALLVADNKISQLSEWDYDKLHDVISEFDCELDDWKDFGLNQQFMKNVFTDLPTSSKEKKKIELKEKSIPIYICPCCGEKCTMEDIKNECD